MIGVPSRLRARLRRLHASGRLRAPVGAPGGLRRAGAALALLLVAGALLAGRAGAADLTCERVPQLVAAYFQKHIHYGYLDDRLRERAVDSYIKRLDPSKTLYLASEAEALRARLKGIFHDVYGGDCSRLQALRKDVVARYEKLEAYVRQSVGSESWELDPDVMLVLDPDKRGHPADEEARRALWEKLVHFQMSNYLGTDMEMAEAKRRLIHRHELMTRRARELEEQDVYANFVDAFATSLDPHSHYFSAEALEDFQIEMRLSLEGIGVALSSRDGYAVVEKIIPGGATDRLDALEPKDKVIAVAQEDGEWVDVIDMDLRDVVRLIRGERGTKVHLRVLRQGEETDTFTVTIVRDKINLEERSARLRMETVGEGEEKLDLAVIELPSFYGDRNPTKRQSSRDLRRLIEQAREQGADGLLLDLSRNGGGLLETAVEIAGFFIDRGGIVAVKGTETGVQVLRDTDPDILWEGPLVVLTSRISASASEIVAGAIKDYRRGVVVGDDHTFGKGTVQSMVPLPMGLGALKVTTALFFRPAGRSTQHTGVSSDIVIPALSGAEDFGEATQPYSLPPDRIQPFLDLGEEPGWALVTDELVSELAQRSQARVAGSERFAEIQEKLAEAQSHDGVVHLAEILEQQETSGEAQAAGGDASVAPPSSPGTSSPAEEDEKPSVQQEEALRILADHVRLLDGAARTADSPPAGDEGSPSLM